MIRVRSTLAAILLLSHAAKAAEDAGSVLVETIPSHLGSLPDIVTAYGTAGPALDGSMTISLQSQGRIDRFLVTPGEAVRAGEPLLQFELSQSALGSFEQARTALATARLDRSRIQDLVQQKLATKDQLTQATKAVTDAQINLDTLVRSGSNQPRVTIKAPFDGVVSTIPVAQGDTIAPGATMMTMIRADGLVVNVGVEPSQRLRLHPGDAVALEDLTTRQPLAAGRLARIDGLINPKTRLVDADIATGAALLPGAAFRADITVGAFKGYVVPRDAVLGEGEDVAIYQVAGGTAHRVAVTIVGSTAEQSVVTGAIDPRRPIVVKGNYQLSDGMAVRVADTAAPPATTASSAP